MTPLHARVDREDPVEAIELLLKAGADVEAETIDRHTPLQVRFSYLSKKNTLGGSFIGPKMRFSHDTEGEAEFLEFGDQVKVRFEFATYDKSEGKEGRAKVTVKGEAVCPRGDAFR